MIAPQHRNRGFILISVLLGILLIALLAVAMLQSGIIVARVTNNFKNELLAFNIADNKLRSIIAQLKKTPITKLPANTTIITTAMCGVVFYRIVVSGTSDLVTTTIKVTFAGLTDSSKCKIPPTIQPGMQSWR